MYQSSPSYLSIVQSHGSVKVYSACCEARYPFQVCLSLLRASTDQAVFLAPVEVPAASSSRCALQLISCVILLYFLCTRCHRRNKANKRTRRRSKSGNVRVPINTVIKLTGGKLGDNSDSRNRSIIFLAFSIVVQNRATRDSERRQKMMHESDESS